MDDGVFHGCELGSRGVGDTLICLENIGAHPGASPANEGITLTIGQHPPLIRHFHGRDLILIRKMKAKEIK